MNLEWLHFGWEVFTSFAGLIAALFALVLNWITRRDGANKQALIDAEKRLDRRDEEMTDTLDDLRDRLGRVEETLKHLPTVNDISGVRDAVSTLATQIAELKGAQTGTTRMVERMNEYLMRKGD